jgi:hypothetical protein
MMSRVIAERLRAAADGSRLAELIAVYAPDARLEGAVPGRELAAVGRDAVVAELASWWAAGATVDDWEVTLSRRGLAIIAQGTHGSGDSTRRYRHHHWLHLDPTGRVRRHYVYSAAPADGSLCSPVPSFLRDARWREPIEGRGGSGARVERACLHRGEVVVVKYVTAATDWIMRATADQGREATLWTSGALRPGSGGPEYPVVDVEPIAGGWAVAFRDVDASLLRTGRRLRRDEARRLLAAAEGLHRRFAGDVPADACTMTARAATFAPDIADRERAGDDLVPKLIGRGWPRFFAAAEWRDAHLGSTLRRLVGDPAPLIAELERDGTTLIHGDFKHAHLGFVDDGVIAIDWGLACRAPAEVELAWYLECGQPSVDARRTDIIADWCALRGGAVDVQRLRLALLFEVVLSGWSWALFAAEAPDPQERAASSEALGWWLDQAAVALATWSPS